ncbi:MAG: hypothetical protein AAGI34_07700 [Pseudomonadota bacterium]
MTPSDNGTPARGASRWRAIGLWALLLALYTLFLLPGLGRVHVEGFGYLSETLAMLFPDIAAADPIWSANYRFFYLSRAGVIWLLSALTPLAPSGAYALVFWLAMPFYVGGLILLTRLWSGTSWLAAVAALLCFPILFEATFFFNDNVLGVSLSLWGLIILVWSNRLAWAALAGALLSVAVLCRLDQVLLLPLFLFLAALPAPTLTAGLLRAGLLALAAVLVHALAGLIDPDVANVVARARQIVEIDALWERGNFSLPRLIQRDASTAVVAFSMALPAVLAGVAALLPRTLSQARQARTLMSLARALARPACFLLYPLAVYVITIGKYYDPRAFLTVLMLLTPLAALGLQRWVIAPLLASQTARLKRRHLPAALVGLALVGPVLIPAVPSFPEFESQATLLTGRVWQTAAWQRWQDGVRERDGRIEAVVGATLTRQDSVVLTSSWTRERSIQHSLLKQGFTPSRSNIEACTRLLEVWQHPEHAGTLYLVRLRMPFVPDWRDYTAAFYRIAAPCLRAFPPEQRFALVQRAAPDLDAVVLGIGTDGLIRVSEADLAAYDALSAQQLSELYARSPALQAALPEEAATPDAIAEHLLRRAKALLD